jgi:hypothetical protein
MPGWIFAVIVLVFAVAGVVFVRSTQKRAVVERLPLEPGEEVVLEEEGLKLFHRFRKTAARGGGTVTHRVRATLTDRRLLLTTGGPEGRHKYVLLMILDYTTPAEPVPETGYDAYKRKFRLDNGYPTYAFSAPDEHGDAETLSIAVPFPEAGPGWGDPPEVRLSTAQAERYREAIAHPRGEDG